MTTKPPSEGFSTEQMLGLSVLILIVVLLKYLPIVFLGALIGLTLLTPQVSRLEHLQRLALSLIGLALILFILFGLPYNPNFYPGLFAFSDFFYNACKSIARYWDESLGRIPFYRIRAISLLNVTNYVWLTVPIAAGVSFLGLFPNFLSSFFDKFPRNRGSISHPLQRLVLSLARLFIVRPFRIGKLGILPITTVSVLTVLAYCLLSAAFILLVPLSPYPDLKITFAILAPLPAIFMALGRFLRNTPTLVSRARNKDSTGFQLGIASRRPFYLTEPNLNHHVELVAPTGTGKTTILKALLIDRIEKGHNVIFMDFKGEFKLLSWMYRLLKASKREEQLRLFSLADPLLSTPYNPIETGSHSEIHSQIMNSITWSDEYYKAFSSSALLTLLKALCEHRDKTGEKFHLGHVRTLLQSPKALTLFLEKLKSNACDTTEISDLLTNLSADPNRKNLSGLLCNLSLLVHSSCGELLTNDTEKGALSLSGAFQQPSVVYFLMNSLKLRETAAITAKLILQDLMKQIGEEYGKPQSAKRPVTLVIDEFAEFAVPDFVNMLDKARGAGVSVVIAHQSRADLRRISPEFQERVEANASTTIVSGIKNPLDAEYYAGILGTHTTEKETLQKRKGLFLNDEDTGLKTVREVEEFIVHPNRIKELNRGEVLVICRTVDPKWGVVSVPLPFEYNEMSDDDLKDHLSCLRKNYVLEGGASYLSLTQKEQPAEVSSADSKDKPHLSPPPTLDWHSYTPKEALLARC